jgi:hypothetical protein
MEVEKWGLDCDPITKVPHLSMRMPEGMHVQTTPQTACSHGTKVHALLPKLVIIDAGHKRVTVENKQAIQCANRVNESAVTVLQAYTILPPNVDVHGRLKTAHAAKTCLLPWPAVHTGQPLTLMLQHVSAPSTYVDKDLKTANAPKTSHTILLHRPTLHSSLSRKLTVWSGPKHAAVSVGGHAQHTWAAELGVPRSLQAPQPGPVPAGPRRGPAGLIGSPFGSPVIATLYPPVAATLLARAPSVKNRIGCLAFTMPGCPLRTPSKGAGPCIRHTAP